MTNIKKIALINLSITLVLLLVIECALMFALPKKDRETFFFQRNRSPTISETLIGLLSDDMSILNKLDPQLGWNINCNKAKKIGLKCKNGFNIYELDTEASSFKIVVLGGSAADTSYLVHNWPSQLFNILKDEYHLKVYNGAVAGYRSNQELTKLIRDGLTLKPDLIISYSGANEDGLLKPYYFSSDFHRRIYEMVYEDQHHLLLPNTIKYLKSMMNNKLGFEGVEYGVPHSADAANNWLFNTRIMRSVSKEFNIDFISILQPVFGLGDTEHYKEKYKSMLKFEEIPSYQDFYSKATKHANDRDIFDFSNIFVNNPDLFLDDCHISEGANLIVAKKVSLLIKHLIPKKFHRDKSR